MKRKLITTCFELNIGVSAAIALFIRKGILSASKDDPKGLDSTDDRNRLESKDNMNGLDPEMLDPNMLIDDDMYKLLQDEFGSPKTHPQETNLLTAQTQGNESNKDTSTECDNNFRKLPNQAKDMKNNPQEHHAPDKSRGLYGLGFVANLPKKENENSGKDDCISILNNMIGNKEQPITLQDIDDYIRSADCQLQYLDADRKPAEKQTATILRFKIPYKDKYNGDIYGEFTRKEDKKGFIGVTWCQNSIGYLYRYGCNIPDVESSITKIQTISNNHDITKANIASYIIGEEELLNGAGYSQKDGNPTSRKIAQFIRFKTSLMDKNGKAIYLWFTRTENGFTGIECGNEDDFKQAKNNQQRFNRGRLSFESKEQCNKFLAEVASLAMKEPWDFKIHRTNDVEYPILASYLEQELNRLFYEYEELGQENKIIFNKNRTKAIFNTNLLDNYCHTMLVIGDVVSIASRICVKNPKLVTQSRQEFEKNGFKREIKALPPRFFGEINDIIFHSEWDVDIENTDKTEHIIKDNISRFPKKYQDDEPFDLSLKLKYAIDHAKEVAQRNYKFIVPMYYPTRNRIQLLMPIYLDGKMEGQPDFALVITPINPKEKDEKGYYVPETILGLEEVYQDARLIAKPDETWLNPTIIE